MPKKKKAVAKKIVKKRVKKAPRSQPAARTVKTVKNVKKGTRTARPPVKVAVRRPVKKPVKKPVAPAVQRPAVELQPPEPSLGRPLVTQEEKLYMLFHDDYQCRQVFEFLRVETVKELEEFTPQQIVHLMSRPIRLTVDRIRQRLAQFKRSLKDDKQYATEFQQTGPAVPASLPWQHTSSDGEVSRSQ